MQISLRACWRERERERERESLSFSLLQGCHQKEERRNGFCLLMTSYRRARNWCSSSWMGGVNRLLISSMPSLLPRLPSWIIWRRWGTKIFPLLSAHPPLLPSSACLLLVLMGFHRTLPLLRLLFSWRIANFVLCFVLPIPNFVIFGLMVGEGRDSGFCCCCCCRRHLSDGGYWRRMDLQSGYLLRMIWGTVRWAIMLLVLDASSSKGELEEETPKSKNLWMLFVWLIVC